MFKKLSAFVLLLLHSYHARRDYQLAFMACQLKALRRRLGVKRIILSVEERRELEPDAK